MDRLTAIGWTEEWAQRLPAAGARAGLAIGRVTQEQKIAYMVRTEAGEWLMSLAGAVRHEAKSRDELPAVGDWVLARRGAMSAEGISGQIVTILPRQTVLARALGTGERQILASNVQIAFLITALNANFNLRRMERYLSLVEGTGVTPVLLLTKSDLVEDAAGTVAQVQAMALRIPVHAISSYTKAGFEVFGHYMKRGVTAVLLGSSGVGKSTLVNHLAQADIQDMMEAREFDDKGRHCTTFRHLIPVAAPLHGAVIDTPGMRALGLGEAEEGVASAFADVEALTLRCRFTNCRHTDEPGCAVRSAITEGALEAERWINYEKLQREISAVGRKQQEIDQRKETKRNRKGMEKRARRAGG